MQLPPDSHGLTVRTGLHVQRLIFESETDKSFEPCKSATGTNGPKSGPVGGEDDPRVVGVKCKLDTGTESEGACVITATREVVLCAGSIGSVQVLERSGIGCGERLSALGLNGPLANGDLPAVGENLQDHLQVRANVQIQSYINAKIFHCCPSLF